MPLIVLFVLVITLGARKIYMRGGWKGMENMRVQIECFPFAVQLMLLIFFSFLPIMS